MTFETASTIFMGTGTILFGAIFIIKRIHISLSLLLALISIMWSVLAFKYWGVTFPEQYGWMPILLPIIGILSAMTILGKGMKRGKDSASSIKE
jgi:hypothetical protein